MRISWRSAARIAIYVQFAALIRCLAEYFRLKHILGPALSLARVEPFILGALVSSVCALAAVLCYFAEKYWLAVGVATLNVAVLFWLKFASS